MDAMEEFKRRFDNGTWNCLGYDCENIVTEAAESGPETLDYVLSRLKEMNEDLLGMAYAHDADGFSALSLYGREPRLKPVFLKYGFFPYDLKDPPFYDEELYEAYKKRRDDEPAMLRTMRNIAERTHAGQLRKDGITPYIRHPQTVTRMIAEWGATFGYGGWLFSVAMGHDVFEESPREQWSALEKEIRNCGADCAKDVLDGILLLTCDKAVFPEKPDYIRHVAEKASDYVLGVKIADRVCNTLDFLKMAETDASRDWRAKAAEYLEAGAPLYARVSSDKLGFFFGDIILQTIDALRATLRGEPAEMPPLLTPHLWSGCRRKSFEMIIAGPIGDSDDEKTEVKGAVSEVDVKLLKGLAAGLKS